MKSPLIALSLLALAACASSPARPASQTPKIDARHFPGQNAVFLLYDLRKQAMVAALNEPQAAVRHTACSTFKVPLAVMAFDAGLLADESTALPWDGVTRSIESWNRDHTAATWMQNSVVWYSQELARRLGREKFQGYLDAFGYGNRDLSAGLTSAWLTVTRSETDPGRGSLQISPLEQLEFQRRLWTGKLPVAPEALRKARALTFLETSPKGFTLHGKTGSGYPQDVRGDFGWFVGHLEGPSGEWLTVAYFERTAEQTGASYPGMLARRATRAILEENGLW